jgi:hypothetical protein
MKFKSLTDLHLFLAETQQYSLLEVANSQYKPDQEIVDEFLKRRREIVNKMKDFRKSQDAKQSWRANRYKIMKGIGAFHKSTEGKRFHRNLGRFLATRMSGNENYNVEEVTEALKALSSIPTHLFIESEYYQPSIEEQLSLEYIIEENISDIHNIINKISKFDFNLTEKEDDLLIRFVPIDILKQCLIEKGIEQTDDLIKQKLGIVCDN